MVSAQPLTWSMDEVMNFKFWENRNSSPSGDYTKDVVALAILNASGQALRGVPAAIEICAGVWQRGMATASISPLNARTAALTPSTLGHIGRYLLRYGQVVFEIGVDPVLGQLTLRPAQSWEVYGGADPSTWEYELSFQGPSQYETRRVPAPRVLNLRYAQAHNAPWRGVGPLTEAGLTQGMVIAIEAALAQEANTPHGYNIAVPDPSQAGNLTTELRRAKGQLTLVPSVASDSAWGQGVESKPSDDFVSKRMGMMPPLPMVELRSRSELSILAAAGVPVTIMSTSDGTAKKEDFRRFLHLTLQPIGKILADQIGAALGVQDLAFDFTDIGAADIAAKARAYGTLIKGGVTPEDAGEIVGLPIDAPTAPALASPGASEGG